MRVILLHNPTAGNGDWSAQKLKNLFARNGHEVSYASTKEANWEITLRERAQTVAVAGGDGTIGLVALRVAERGLPFCVLPVGTANNIAACLGCNGTPVEQIVERLTRARTRKVDLGTVASCRGSQPFIEAVGAGVLAELMRIDPPVRENLTPEHKIRQARMHLVSILDDYEGFTGEVRCDGKVMKGRFLAVEIMNIDRIGPSLILAPKSDAGDGKLDVMCITTRERKKLKRYLEALIADEEEDFPFPARRCHRARLSSSDCHLHVDDEDCDVPTAEVRLLSPALRLLDVNPPAH